MDYSRKFCGEHVYFFEEEADRLAEEPLNISADFVLLVMSGGGTLTINDLLRTFCSSLVWPLLSDEERFEAVCRLRCAAWHCRDLPDDEIGDMDGRSFLESVLIDYWQCLGQREWVYEELLGGKRLGFVPEVS